MGAALYGTDTVCMAVLAVSADMWAGASRAKGIDTAVMVIQLVSLLGEWGANRLRSSQTKTTSSGVWYRTLVSCAQLEQGIGRLRSVCGLDGPTSHGPEPNLMARRNRILLRNTPPTLPMAIMLQSR